MDTMPVPKRRLELDYFRVFAILGMIGIHLLENCIYLESYVNQNISYTSLSGISSLIIEYLGLGAAVFIFALGVGIVYSRRSTFSYLMKRGFLILAIALILQFICVGIPNLLYWIINGELWETPSEIFGWLFCSDILVFAAFAFMFFALVVKFRLNNLVVAGIPVLFLIIASLMPDIVSDNFIFEIFFGWFFWQDTGFSFFPVFSWLIFASAGYIFGKFLIKQESVRTVYTKVLAISLIVTVLLGLIYSLFGVDIISFFTLHEGQIYHQSLLSVLWVLPQIGIWLSVLFFLSLVLEGKKISDFAVKMGKQLTTMYCIQWVLISWTAYAADFAGLLPFDYPTVGVLLVVFTLLTGLLASWFKKNTEY